MAQKTDVASRVTDLTQDTIENLGYELLEVLYLKEHGEFYLRFIIDKRGGISLEDCETVSYAVEPILDEQEYLSKAYNLEVQSPGVDRPLITDRDFARYLGAELEFKLYSNIAGEKQIIGILDDFDEENFYITVTEVPGLNKKLKKGQKKKAIPVDEEGKSAWDVLARAQVANVKQQIRF